MITIVKTMGRGSYDVRYFLDSEHEEALDSARTLNEICHDGEHYLIITENGPEHCFTQDELKIMRELAHVVARAQLEPTLPLINGLLRIPSLPWTCTDNIRRIHMVRYLLREERAAPSLLL